MTPAELFGVIVRSMGVVLLGWATMMVLIGLFTSVEGVLLGVAGWLLGLYLLRGAPWLQRTAYPFEPPPRDGFVQDP